MAHGAADPAKQAESPAEPRCPSLPCRLAWWKAPVHAATTLLRLLAAHCGNSVGTGNCIADCRLPKGSFPGGGSSSNGSVCHRRIRKSHTRQANPSFPCGEDCERPPAVPPIERESWNKAIPHDGWAP